jgi:uroporphyrinogen III methyltransferase/synthase
MKKIKTKGKVFLVGVGPGNEGLVTQAALRCIKQADVIIYDHLMSASLLEHKKPNAKIIYAGKSPGKHSVRQKDINALLIRHAKNNNIVVRLKGGDPFLFGRGSEEALAVKKAKIDFEVISGVSSGFAVANYSGIPLTHRGIASYVTFVTGHEDPDKLSSSIDWKKLASLEGTLVIFMGMARLDTICKILIKHGKKRATPVCITQWGTLPIQRSLSGTLANISEKVKKAGITNPAIIIIGDVVKLRDKLNWFEHKPLFGKNILITRPSSLAGELSDELEQAGAKTVTYPLIEIVKEPGLKEKHILDGFRSCDWVVFTSRNAVRICCEILERNKKDLRFLSDSKVAVLGSQTQKVLEGKGIISDLVPRKFYMESLLAEFKKINIKHKRIFIPHSKQGRPVLVKELKKQGAVIDEIFVYQAKIPKAVSKNKLRKLLQDENFDIITFTSSSCVRSFMQHLDYKNKDKKMLSKLVFASIGPITKNTLESYGFKAAINAKVFTASGLAKAIRKYEGFNK